ncbi:hypothetical protein COLO4_16075 [Corchorus olitorius]|uniref:Uncharacterized protein n=1 Tax=Corchorus olitorius TaxID=93759 RepID=A0A1R3JJQ1_9ROSI|nr:hypothetical protein COLO4_16075 [Corchorus olitorius]
MAMGRGQGLPPPSDQHNRLVLSGPTTILNYLYQLRFYGFFIILHPAMYGTGRRLSYTTTATPRSLK